MRISDWSSDVCSSDLSCAALSTWRNRWDWMSLPRAWKASSNLHSSPAAAAIFIKASSAPARWQARNWRSLYEAGLLSGTPAATPPPLPRSEEHTSELQSLMRISYAVFCLKKKKKQHTHNIKHTKLTKTTKVTTMTHSKPL